MIEYLKVKDWKGIKTCYLSNMEKVNILCGKNSSGKSSILEAISKEPTVAYGFDIGVRQQEYLCSIFDPMFENTLAGAMVPKGFRQYLGTIGKDIIFSDSVPEASKKLKEFLNRYLRHNYAFHFEGFFQRCFAPLIQTQKVLVPPKRRLEVVSGIKFNEQALPSGENLVNRLFFLKNQDPSSEAYKTYNEIYNQFAAISGGYFFNIVPNNSNQIAVYFSTDKISWVKADACGLGLSDLLIILSFVIDFDYSFIMVEEPENHLHPVIQRKLLKFFQEQKDKQFLLATHSNILLDGSLVDKIFFCEMKDQVTVSDNTSKANILSTLGYTAVDNLVSDLIVLTEGPSDEIILKCLCSMLKLDEYVIKFWALGGDIMDQQDLSCLVEGSKVVALVDSDPGSEKVRNRFIKACEDHKIKGTKLNRYAIENYLSLGAIKKVFPATPKELSELDPSKKVEEQLGFSIKNNFHKILKHMTSADFEGTDLWEFCKGFEGIIRG